jgi:hypothetical protein
MIGIPYRISRQAEDGTLADKTVYLATPRSGERGNALRRAIRDQRRLSFELAEAAGRLERQQRRVEKAMDSAADLSSEDAALTACTKTVALLLEAVEDATELAVKLSLEQNYGADKAAEVLDQLATQDLNGMLLAIEQGQQPKDFFPSPVAPQK